MAAMFGSLLFVISETGPFFMVLSLVLYYFAVISPWKKTWPFINEKPEGAYNISSVKIGQLVLENKIFKNSSILIISQLSPFVKQLGTSFDKKWIRIPFIKKLFVPSLIELAQMFWRRRHKFCQSIFAISLLSPL